MYYDPYCIPRIVWNNMLLLDVILVANSGIEYLALIDSPNYLLREV